MSVAWRNRIAGYGDEAPDQLLANPKNWRRHPKHQQDALQGVLEEVGWLQDVIVNRTTGRLIDGHLRVELALRHNAASVPVKYVDLTEEEENLALATFDPLSALAFTDGAQLAQLLEEVSTESDAVHALLDDLAAEAAEAGTEGHPFGAVADPEAIPDLPSDPRVKPGDLWLLGRHRLVCGDMREAGVMARALDGELADLVWTDPPYNVAYVGKTKDALTIQNDAMSDPQFFEFLGEAFRSLWAGMKAGCPYYLTCPSGNKQRLFWNALEEAGLPVRQSLVWLKNSMVLGHSDYHYQHEPVLYGWKAGAHWFTPDRTKVSVFAVDRPSRSEEHPTAKPLALIDEALKNSSHPGDLVLDPFGGSGSTLAACALAGRRCATVELDPVYADVIVTRWERLTGEAAVRVEAA